MLNLFGASPVIGGIVLTDGADTGTFLTLRSDASSYRTLEAGVVVF